MSPEHQHYQRIYHANPWKTAMKPSSIANHLYKTITQICLLGLILCAMLCLGCDGRQPASLSEPAASAAVSLTRAAVAPVPTLAPPLALSSPTEPGVIEVRVEAEVVPPAPPAQLPRRRGIFRGRR